MMSIFALCPREYNDLLSSRHRSGCARYFRHLWPQQEVNWAPVKIREPSKQNKSVYSFTNTIALYHHHGQSTDTFAMLQRLSYDRKVRGRRCGNRDFSGAGEWRHRLASGGNLADAHDAIELQVSLHRSVCFCCAFRVSARKWRKRQLINIRKLAVLCYHFHKQVLCGS